MLILLFSSLSLFIAGTVSCDEKDSSNTGESELLIWNLQSQDSILVKVIPIGFVFSGDTTYKPLSIHTDSLVPHILGGYKILKEYDPLVNPRRFRFWLNHDVLRRDQNTNDSCIGWGKYRIEFYEFPDSAISPILVDYLTIDFADTDYPYRSSTPWFAFTNDFFIYYYSSQNIRVKFANAEGVSIRITENR